MVELGKKLLEGVGDGELFIKEGECAMHVRKALNFHEVEGLPSAWLAIPAVDMA